MIFNDMVGFNNSKVIYLMAKIDRKNYFSMDFGEAQACRDEFN